MTTAELAAPAPADLGTVVRVFGQVGAPRHRGDAITDPAFDAVTQPYRLRCTGSVVDVMAYGSPLAAVTCKRCLQLEQPEFARYQDAARYVGKALGVEGDAGGWIYRTEPWSPLTQGWSDFIGRWAPGTIDVVRAQDGQAADYGRRYRVNVAQVARLAALPAWRRLVARPDNHAPDCR